MSALAIHAWAEAADRLTQARSLRLIWVRTDFIGPIEQWVGDTARLQGDRAQAQKTLRQHFEKVLG